MKSLRLMRRGWWRRRGAETQRRRKREGRLTRAVDGVAGSDPFVPCRQARRHGGCWPRIGGEVWEGWGCRR
ncbi:hypothetical protein PS2_034876 [Malus domestica]